MDVLGLIVAHARSHPGAAAAKDHTRALTFSDLEAETAQLAAGLTGLGIGPGQRVALHLPNSVDFLVATLACLWVGAIFVPLAATDPAARVAKIVNDCDPALVLIPESGPDTERPDTEPPDTEPPDTEPPDTNTAHLGRPSLTISALRGQGAAVPAPVVAADRGAYAIYTSGTTGLPKGVLIGRKAFTVALQAAKGLLRMERATRSLCVSPFHFDGSFGTLYPTLVAGGTVIIPRREHMLFPQRFFKAVAADAINFTGFSPSYLRLLLASPQLPRLADTPLATVALGGEACSAADVQALWSAVPGLRVFNRYGPTETTIAVTHYELKPRSTVPGQPVPIGQPHPGVTFHLVDEDGSAIEAPGRPGELYIGGQQLMQGYWGDAALTESVLRSDVVAGETVYRTGDMVVRDDSDNYLYVDRANRVIKRSGVRISLVEIAEALQGVPGVTGAVCVAFDKDGQLGIAAFVVPAASRTVDLMPIDIRRSAGEHLPSTMLPDLIKVVDSLPLTSSGKVDETLLLADAALTKS